MDQSDQAAGRDAAESGGAGRFAPETARSRDGLGRFFDSVEGLAGGAWSYGLLLGAWIFARNLLESIIEAGHMMGFDWRVEISAPMFFLHFPLFYLTLFLLLALWLHLLTRAPMHRIAKTVAVGFALLLVAPVVDLLVSGGRGYDLRYLMGLDAVLWRFWDPRAGTAEISPGQRVEILLAIVMLGLYCAHLTRRGRAPEAGPHALADDGRFPRARVWIIAAVGMGGSFLLMAALGAWPALFARLWQPAVPGDQAYVALYRLRGLVANESARHALVLALPFLTALLLFARSCDPRRFGSLARRIFGLRLAHYTGLVPLGAYIGWLVYRDHLPGAFANPIDAVAVIVLWAGMAAAFTAAVCWNDLGDRLSDEINRRPRPIGGGHWTPAQVEQLGAAAALLALLLAFGTGYAPFLLVAACLVLSWLYSRPPARLKRWPLVATFVLGLLSLASMAAGFALFGQELTAWAFPRGLAAALLIGITIGFVAKDLGDADGDRAGGVATIATLCGERMARRIAAGLVAVAFLQVPLWLPLGIGGWVAALACAALGIHFALRATRPAEPLLAVQLAFALTLAGLITHDAQILRRRGPSWVGLAPGEIRGLEEDIRLTLLERQAQANGDSPAEIAAGFAGAEGLNLDGRFARVRFAYAHGPAGTPDVWAERGRATLAQIGPAARRVEAAQRLAGMRPLHAPHYDAWKVAAQEAGDLEEAMRACDRALALLIRPADYLRERAALGLASVSPPESLRAPTHDLAGAFLFGRLEERLWILAGDTALRGQRADQARQAFEQAIRLSPDEADAWSGLAQAFFQSRLLSDALAAIQRAHRLAPRDPWVLNNWGVILREAGSPDEAATRFEEARRLAPGFFEPLFNLGLTCEMTGRSEQALKWYGRAQTLRPDFPPLMEALRRLRVRPIAGSDWSAQGDAPVGNFKQGLP